MTTISSTSPFATPSLADRLTALATQGNALAIASASTSGNAGASAFQLDAVQSADSAQTDSTVAQTDMLRQMKAEAALSKDTKTLADTVTDAFQTILAQRPDLADAYFDFVSDKGSIKVISNALSPKDRQWLEDQLNANTGLVDAVNGFNNDLGKLLSVTAATNAATPGAAQSYSAAAVQAAQGKIDGAVHFLSLFQNVAYEAGKTGWDKDSTYTDGQGKAVDLTHAHTNTLAGMIDAKRQLDALQNGTIVTQTKEGKLLYGVQVNADPYAVAATLAPLSVPGWATAAGSTAPSTATTPSGTGASGSLVNRMV